MVNKMRPRHNENFNAKLRMSGSGSSSHAKTSHKVLALTQTNALACALASFLQNQFHESLLLGQGHNSYMAMHLGRRTPKTHASIAVVFFSCVVARARLHRGSTHETQVEDEHIMDNRI